MPSRECEHNNKPVELGESTVVFVEVTTYVGISLGAQHWYGEMVGDATIPNPDNPSYFSGYERRDVKRKLTAAGARKMTMQKYKTTGGVYIDLYEAGDWTNAFDSEEDVEKYAMRSAKKCFPKLRLLLSCRGYRSADPEKVLWCESAADQIALYNLWHRWEIINGWQNKKNEREAREIAAEWDEIMKKYTKEDNQ